MTNDFEGKDETWLLARRSYLQDILASGAGSKSHVGIEQGVFHEYAEMSQKELRATLRSVRYSLWCLNPDKYTNPFSGKVMRVTTLH